MQIVIEIREEDYKRVKTRLNTISLSTAKELYVAVFNGTPLPKEHGKLIDADDLYKQTAEWEAQALAQVERYSLEYSREEWRWWSAVLKERGAFKRDLENAQTILEANKE